MVANHFRVCKRLRLFFSDAMVRALLVAGTVLWVWALAQG
jgi:hypothetical protein